MGVMSSSLPQGDRARHLTQIDRPSPAKAQLLTAREKREKAARLLRTAITRSDLKLMAVCDKDHGQLSREIDDKEKLSFHEMYARWDAAVWIELIPLLAKEFGMEVERVIRLKEVAR